ncbi:hypothetical protein X801_04425 [Opisthorchis viverrini]|uniref:Uncharacterized protein n=1 Tax=Opisthorchis viverrini TaxID=6198 RepID=A0A1S8WZ44_OPIVI|nr:hypothetical protein X801_04425 [Opisthorchis viverrini]
MLRDNVEPEIVTHRTFFDDGDQLYLSEQLVLARDSMTGANTLPVTEDSDLVSGEEEDQEMSARCARIPLEDSNQTPKINGANQGIASRVENAVGPHKQFDGSAATIHKNRPRVRQHSDVTDFMQIYYGGFGTREEDIPNHNRYRPFQKIMQILSSMEKEQRLSDEDEGFAEPIPSQPIGDNAEESAYTGWLASAEL